MKRILLTSFFLAKNNLFRSCFSILSIFKIVCLLLVSVSFAIAQEPVIPKAKTKEEKKAERKKMTLEERIEDMAPIDVSLPKASVNLPNNKKISSVEDAKKIVTDTKIPTAEEAKKYISDTKVSSVEEAKKFVNETLPDLGIKAKKKVKKAKELAKEAAKVFDGKQYEGITVEKKVLKRGSGTRLRYTEFYVSKKNTETPNPYIKSIYWFDEKRQRVVEALIRDRATNKLMHGPYKDYLGEVLVEEGYYYLGTKHGIWAKYDKDFNLSDKTTFNKGFLDGSVISFYDLDSTKIKEVIPNWYGKQSGEYFMFHENGTLAIQGQMDNGVKVGKWVEYYATGNRRKKEMQYGLDCFDTMEAYVIREYDESGKMTYEKK